MNLSSKGIDLYTIQKENHVEDILNKYSNKSSVKFDQKIQELKKKVNMSFWARQVLKFDRASCGTKPGSMDKDELIDFIKKDRS